MQSMTTVIEALSRVCEASGISTEVRACFDKRDVRAIEATQLERSADACGTSAEHDDARPSSR
jgi:hypothetical protein